MQEKGRIVAKTIAIAGLSAIPVSIVAEYSSYDQLQRVRACVYQNSDSVPLITYSNSMDCGDVQRGRAFRLDCAHDESAMLQDIAQPCELKLDVFREDFRMFKQEGRTCSLASSAAILSDMSLRYGGAAIDPYVLSDIVESQSLIAGNIYDELESVDQMNIQSEQLSALRGRVPFNPNVLFEMQSLSQGDFPLEPFQFYSFITSIMEDPDGYVLLSSRVTANKKADFPNHAVVVVGTGRDAMTGEPYILVAEPNAGLFVNSPNFSAVQEEWVPINPGGFTTAIRLTQKSMELMFELTVLKSIPIDSK